EAMVADPTAHGDADGRDLLAIREPHAGAARDAPALEPEARERGDQRVLERTEPAVEIAADAVQVDDRVTDQLAGSVPGDVAAARHLHHLDAEARECPGVRAHVSLARTPAHGQHRL